MDGLSNFFACEFYYSLFHILMIKSNYRVDRALFKSFENLSLVIIGFDHKDMKNEVYKKAQDGQK